jgi:hypothetical protein
MNEIMAELPGIDPDSDEAVALWLEAEQIIVEEIPFLTFGFSPAFVGWSDAVINVDVGRFGPNGITRVPYAEFIIERP